MRHVLEQYLTRELHISKVVSWYQTMGELYGSGRISLQHTLLPDFRNAPILGYWWVSKKVSFGYF